jgi:hypothetical protein
MWRYLLPIAAEVGIAAHFYQHYAVAPPFTKSTETSESYFFRKIKLLS